MNQPNFNSVTFILIAISSALLGISMALMGHHGHIKLITDFYGISSLLPAMVFNLLAVAGFVILTVLSVVSLRQASVKQILGVALIAVSLVPLVALFSSSMWLDALGGFPAIGSGQGVIKYFALLSIGVLLVKPTLSINTQLWVIIAPVLIVLLWIGGMKFTLFEAQGIETLVKTSPFMAWMYQVWDLQMTSNLIGVYDLIAVVLLVVAIYQPKLAMPAILMSGAVFVVTQTFLISWESALSAETLLSTGGHFLIKDLWFVANLIMFWQLLKQREAVTA